MSEKKFTFVELHLEGAQFGPSTIADALPFGEAGTGLEGDTETEPAIEDSSGDLEDEESGSKGKAAIGALVALAVLVAAGVAVRKFRGDDEEEATLEEEPEVIVN